MYIFNESKFSRKVAKNESNNIVVTSPGIAINVKNNKCSGDFLGCSFHRKYRKKRRHLGLFVNIP